MRYFEKLAAVDSLSLDEFIITDTYTHTHIYIYIYIYVTKTVGSGTSHKYTMFPILTV